MKGPSRVRSILQRSLALVFLAALGALLWFGWAGLPFSADPTLHVASRYVDLGPGETGWTSSFLSALLDYRSFYLTLLSLLDLGLVLGVLLYCVSESIAFQPVEKFLLAITGLFTFVLLFWGGLGLLNDGSWMDYEFLSGSTARMRAGLVSGSLMLGATLAAVLLALSIWNRGKGGSFGRK